MPISIRFISLNDLFHLRLRAISYLENKKKFGPVSMESIALAFAADF